MNGTLNISFAADRADCVYGAGETASLSLSASSADGVMAREGVVHIRVDNYGSVVSEERDVDLAAENPVRLTVTRATPGFARISVSSRTTGMEVVGNAGNPAGTYVFGVAFSPGEIRPGTPYPEDFMDFWTDAVRKLDETVPADPRMELVPERSAGPCNYWRVSFATYGGRRVYGWLSEPKAEGRHPVRINVPGAGIGACGTGVDANRITLTMNVHSYRQSEGDTPEAAAERQRLYEEQDEIYAKPTGAPRYCQAGIHKGREDYFFYASFLGINRAVNWLAARPECDLSAFDYAGTSQGGGFGLMLTALNRHITRSCIYVPAITDLMSFKVEGRQSGWPQIIENQAPENRAAAEKWAPYFCGTNFARQIRCPIRFVVGFCDMACAPHAVYSAYNVCPSTDKAILHGVGMGHGVFGHFYTELDQWLSARKILSTGVAIPEEGVPSWGGGMQYTTRMEKRPESIDDEASYLKWKWRMDLSDPATGLDNDALIAGVRRIAAQAKASHPQGAGPDWYDVSAACFEFLADNVAIGFSRFDGFPAISAWNRHARPMGAILWERAAEVDDRYFPGLRAEREKMNKEGRAGIGKDFDHSAPDWADILKLGFPGMKARVDSYAQDTPFYRAEKRAAAAMMRFLDRLVATAKAHPDAQSPWMRKEIASLERLRVGPPQSVFDIMEFTMVYFILSEPLNFFQVRTFDNIDVRWWPYYQADLAAGRTTEAEFREDFRHFLWQFGSIDNYWGHPIYLGGTNRDGTTAYNPLSPIILDVVEKTALPTPKFQLKMAKNTPDDIWWKALDMLRKHCPLCLMSEENMARSMKPVGLTDEECRDLLVWGCFEYLPRAKGNCTSATLINLQQPVVELLAKAAAGEFAAATFDDVKREYFRILHATTDKTVDLLRQEEAHLDEINPALVLSLALGSALEKGVDAFSLGYKYNFTSIAECGFATAVDSLLAVKEFVFDRKALSLAELGRLLAADWEGHEEVRLRMRNSGLKWGRGNPEADALAKEVIEGFTSRFVGKPNSRGGVFVCYGLNSRGFIDQGRITPATPDGRKAGEPLSKNMAPSVGAETEGITGSIRSYAAIAPENFPCGSIYDVMIHPSAVAGEKGLRVFRMLVERFYAVGGVALNINIVSPETLRDAQAHPEKYENLQVRVAGWNIRWNDIPRKEQDDYIARIETVGA